LIALFTKGRKRNGSRKISDLIEEGKTESAGKVRTGMKTMAACLE